MLWIKALHIAFVVCWFAGIFYLPRLFVYHAQSDDAAVRAQLLVMERRLYRFVTPLAGLALLFGGWLTALNLSFYLSQPWFVAKLLLVAVLLAYHWQCGRYIQRFARGEIPHGHIFFRWFNESPVLLLFAIVILVVVRPLG